MNAQDIWTIVRDQVVDNSENFWSDNEIYRYMSMGLREMLLRFPELQQDQTTIPCVINQGNYTLPSNFAVDYVGYVTLTDSTSAAQTSQYMEKLKKIGLTDQMSLYWDSSSTGEPVYYRLYSPTQLNVYPVPDTTGNLLVQYRTHYADLASDSTFSSRVEPYAQNLVDYCQYRMYMKDQELVSEARNAKTLWNENLERMVDILAYNEGFDRYYTVKDEDNNYMSTDLGII